MNKIGVFYGSTTETTEDVAKLTEALVSEYDVLVLVTPILMQTLSAMALASSFAR